MEGLQQVLVWIVRQQEQGEKQSVLIAHTYFGEDGLGRSMYIFDASV